MKDPNLAQYVSFALTKLREIYDRVKNEDLIGEGRVSVLEGLLFTLSLNSGTKDS
jgi:hypothetical protein